MDWNCQEVSLASSVVDEALSAMIVQSFVVVKHVSIVLNDSARLC